MTGHERVIVRAHAKLNLCLAVGPRRPDGYHDLATIFQSISLADTLVARRRRKDFALEVRHESVAQRGGDRFSERDVPPGDENLVVRAARGFAEAFGYPGGAEFILTKRIPSRAGLGGGSADAAATLRAMSALSGIRPPRRALVELAVALGADVPFALRGGTALGLGRGDKLVSLRLIKPFQAVLAVPRWRISTARAFDRLDRRNFTLTEWEAKLRSIQFLSRDRLSAARALRLGNSFEDVLGPQEAQFNSLCDRLKAAGARNPRMTGSGSAVFGIIPSRAIAERVVGRILGTESIHTVTTVTRGLRVRTSVT